MTDLVAFLGAIAALLLALFAIAVLLGRRLRDVPGVSPGLIGEPHTETGFGLTDADADRVWVGIQAAMEEEELADAVVRAAVDYSHLLRGTLPAARMSDAEIRRIEDVFDRAVDAYVAKVTP